MNHSTPNEPAQPAQVPIETELHELGPLENQYRASRLYCAKIIAIGLPPAVGSSLATLLCLWGIFRGGPDVCPFFVLIVVMVGLLLFGARLIYRGAMGLRFSADLFQHGIEIRVAEVTGRARWEDLASIFSNVTLYYQRTLFNKLVPVRYDHQYTIWWSNGKSFTLDDRLNQVEHLARLIQQKICQHRLESAIETIQSGAKVDFAGLEVDAQILSSTTEFLPWNEIERIELSEGYFRILHSAGTTLVPVSDVANIVLCLEVMKHIGGEGRVPGPI